MRGSLAGSVVSNILLVLGAAMIAGGDGEVDARSLRLQLAGRHRHGRAAADPVDPGWHGNPERHSLFVLTIPVAVVLLLAYGVVTVRNLRRPPRAERAEPRRGRLVAATRDRRARRRDRRDRARLRDPRPLAGQVRARVGLGEFFIAIVIVAIVGNAAEHGGAIVIAKRGNTRLATEIAIVSSMQVAVFVAPAVALLSWIVGRGLPLSFRLVEVATMARRRGGGDRRRSRRPVAALGGLFAGRRLRRRRDRVRARL